MADSPYFDSTYFDSYFDTDGGAAPPEPPPGVTIRGASFRPRPEPKRDNEDWITLIL